MILEAWLGWMDCFFCLFGGVQLRKLLTFLFGGGLVRNSCGWLFVFWCPQVYDQKE